MTQTNCLTTAFLVLPTRAAFDYATKVEPSALKQATNWGFE